MEDWNKNEALTASISQIYEKTARSEEEGMHCYRAAQGEVILLFSGRPGPPGRGGRGGGNLEELRDCIISGDAWESQDAVTVDELPATYRRAEL